MPLLANNKNNHELRDGDINEALAYITDYWHKLEKHQAHDDGSLIGLPHPYIVPSVDPNSPFHFDEQYYWDSYFIALGLTHADKQHLVEGMLENLLFLHKKFKMIPNANRMYFLSRSQPPILTSFIFHVYDTYKKPKKWLAERISQAKDEYQNVWMCAKHPSWHTMHDGLARYYDINVLHDLAEAESGWDMTPRFERKCLDYLPIDLNCLLYKYEMDFSRAAEIAGDKVESLEWHLRAKERKATVDKLMWGKIRGFYFDYNFVKKERGSTWSLAAYYALWSGLATPEQAQRLVDCLPKFEREGGLTTTTRPIIDMSIFGSLKTQWAYPNGWAPLHYIVYEGLKKYGYTSDADRIAKKWLATNTHWFAKHGEMLEKYNVVRPSKPPVAGLYPAQSGFGWTNGVYVYFAHELRRSS